MIRLAATADGLLKVSSGNEGRGGYLHGSDVCWHAFVKRKSVYRAFRAEIPRSARETLIRDFEVAKRMESK